MGVGTGRETGHSLSHPPARSITGNGRCALQCCLGGYGMGRLQISLPEEIERLAEQQVATGAYGSVDEYLSDLVLEDRARAERRRTEAILLRRLESGPSREVT